MAADSDESSVSHSHSQSDASSNDDDDSFSPKPSPRTPSSQARKFNNLFAKAGLESDNESSHPSRASTSVSSESHGRSPSQRQNSARSSRSSSAGSHTESRSALSPTSSTDRSSHQDHSSGSPSHSASRSVSASHNSSWDGSKPRSRRSSGTNSESSAPSQESSHPRSEHSPQSRSLQSPRESASSASPAITGNDSESNRNHDSQTASASLEERSNQASRSSPSDQGSPTATNTHESPGRTATNEEPALNSTSDDDGDSRLIASRPKSREDVSAEQQANNIDSPLGNTSDRTSVEVQSPRPKRTETSSQAEHSGTSPKMNPENGLTVYPPTQSSPNESESEPKTPRNVAPVEAIHSDPNESPFLIPPLATTQDEHAQRIDETITDDGKSPAATSDPKESGDTTNLPQSMRSEAPLEKSFDKPQSDHSTTQNKKDVAPRPSILQKLEERRRAMEVQSIAPQEGSTVVVASAPITSKSDDTPGKSSAQMENNQKMPNVENFANPIVDDRSSKLDSQSDYDPRQDDTQKWKDLIRRSTQGSSEQRSSGIFRRGKSDSTGEKAKIRGEDNYRAATDRPTQPETQTAPATSDTKVIDIPSPQQNQSELKVINGEDIKQGWMPPALTTYGEQKFSPAPCLEEKVDPPMKDGFDLSKNIPSQRLSSGVPPQKVFTPPVSEIEVRPPPEDDSSLGSMGFLFPKQAPPTPMMLSLPVETFAAVPAVPAPPEPKKDPTLVTHKLKPTVGGVDYDYYKTWMLPGAQPPKPKQETNHEIDREDPPGTTTVFKPKRMVVEPIPRTRPFAKVIEIDTEAGTPGVPTQSPKPPSESWAPNRLTHSILQSKPTDEWEAWREALDAATKAKLPDSFTKRSTTSDISLTSDWAPPTRPVDCNSKNRSILDGDNNNVGHRWSTWIPQSQASRIDFAGAITSQPPPLSKERKVYNEPVQSTSVDETKEIGSSSSHTSVPDEESHSSRFSASTSASESHDVSDDSATSASDSRSGSHRNPRSEAAGAVDEGDSGLPVHDAVPAEIPSRPGSTDHYDAEKPSPVKPHAIDSKRRFSPFFVCLLVTISMVILGGIVAIVVLVLSGKLGDETSSPAVSPTAPSPSSSPVASPDDLTALISASSPNTASALEDPTSAQALALAWLSKNQFLGTYSDKQKIQRFVLAVIFYSTTGESWNDKDLWVSDIDECDWYSSEVVNEVCNSEHEIDEIDLKMNGLSGEFPWTELVMLSSQLLILDLKENRLSGSIADVVGDMTSLLVFIVENNQFTGTIPSTFGQLTDARQLNLSQNRLSGSIPSEIASMSSLQALWLNDNLLTGTIPSELGQLSNLRSIYLSGNDFVGNMPEEICALSLENLEVNCGVDCSCCTAACGEGSSASPVGGDNGDGNNATDPNPVGDDLVDEELEGNPIYELIVSKYPDGGEALANAESPQRAAFRWLQSSSNAQISSDEHLLQRYALASLFYATGGSQWTSAASWLSEEDECFWYTTSDAGALCDSNGRLIEINLESNNLQGTLPMEIGLLADSLEILDLSGNNMTGSIPTTIERMGLLKQIDLSMNKLFGIVPSELGSMSSLQRIVLSDNNLFSTIPTELGLLSQLDYLDLGSNQLTGTIPDSLGSLRSLAGLALYKNFLSGTLPVSLSDLSTLQLLYLDENDLSGPIPNGICQLTLEEFWSDCLETQCNCCTTCCSDGTGCA